MAEAVDIIAAKGYASVLQPVFVSVDPQRDNIGQVREYLKGFLLLFLFLFFFLSPLFLHKILQNITRP